jgi:RNA polymerase sigma factor (TIGR02999 family)
MTAPPRQGEILRLLVARKRWGPTAQAKLVDLVYSDPHAIAQHYMRRERPDHTLQPTALVHEAYLRLMRNQTVDRQSRAHFLAAASIVMRRTLVDHVRQQAGKHPDAARSPWPAFCANTN